MQWYVQVCTGIDLPVKAIYRYVPVHIITCQHETVCTSMYQYVLVCTSMYWYIPAFTLISNSPIQSFPVTRYITIHQSTWKYMEVPKSPVYLDYDGTTRQLEVRSFQLGIMAATALMRRAEAAGGLSNFVVLPSHQQVCWTLSSEGLLDIDVAHL